MAAENSVVEVFPFVPTTCSARKPRCGSPSSASSARIRSSPRRMPNAARVASRSSRPATRSALQLGEPGLEGLDLALEPRFALPLLRHHGRRGAVDEPGVRELRLRLREIVTGIGQPPLELAAQ